MLLNTDKINNSDSASVESRFVVLEKLENAAKKFSYTLLNECSMNFRNIILQNLFKVLGKMKDKHPDSKAKSTIIEFFNRELEEQLETTMEMYKKTMNLKSLLNMGVCLNGEFIRIHEQGQLGYRYLLLLKILHFRK